MTFRAVLLGLIGAALIAGFTYYNDAIMHGTNFVGNQLPISVYGALIIFVLVINPLLYLIWKRLALSGRELAVALTLTLAACCIPGSGLMRFFATNMVSPHQIAKTTPAINTPPAPGSWRDGSILDKVPEHMMVKVTAQNEKTVLEPLFSNGLITPTKKSISIKEVPWDAWTPVIAFWMPLIFILSIGMLGLALVVHRQWADHEQLPYPIATFANTLLPEKKQIIADVFRSKLFWGGLIFCFFIQFNNFMVLWFPELIPTPMQLQFWPLYNLPIVQTMWPIGQSHIVVPTFYFTVIAFAYFLATDVSLALGLGPYVWYFVAGTFAGLGITLVGGPAMTDTFLAFGAYLGMFLVLMYTGRRYYANAFKAAFGIKTQDVVKPESLWGARLFVASMAIFIIYATVLGKLEWQFAVLFACIATLLFLVMTRIVAETGVFFLQAWFTPASVIIGLFGMAALGPQTVLVLMLLSSVMLADPREAFMPFILNSFKLLDMRQVSVPKSAGWATVALVLGIVIAVPVTIYLQYGHGFNMQDGWSVTSVPSLAFNKIIELETKLGSMGILPMKGQEIHGFQHFAKMAPNIGSILALVVGMGLVLLFTIGRLRFTKWPIHPVMFLVWVTYPAPYFAPSFLIGWLVKSLVTKYGGGALYRSLKPLMFGMIAGELTAGFLAFVLGAVLSVITNQPPKTINIFPG